MTSLRHLFVASLVLALAGCGVGYIPAKVDVSAGNVTVIALTTESVQIANSNTYVPRQLPEVFFQNAGSPSAFRGAGASPPPSLTEELRPTTLTTRLPPATDHSPYRIGVGDVLLLATRSAAGTVEERSGLLAAQNSRQGYTVQHDGAIAVPDVGRIVLAGLTLKDAEAELFQSLVQKRIDPTFSLEIAEFNSKRVSVGGAVAMPAIVPIALTPLYLDEALTVSGGISTPDVDFASIRIYRDGSLYQIPLVQYLREPALQKTLLIAGDNVFVDTEFELEKARAYFQEQITLSQFRQQGRVQALAELNAEIELRRAALTEERSNFQERITLDAVEQDYVYLAGEVTQQGRFPLPFGRQATLADALFATGGFSSETGNPSQIYVLRSAEDDLGAITAWNLDARNISNMVIATRFNLLPNDIVFVAEQPITRWNRVVQQLVPSLITTGVGLATR